MFDKRSIAVMQPYFFPYIGYFQMINAVDKFVLYDDVNYIKNGWINRNQILNGTSPQYINAIIEKASPNKKINEHHLNKNLPWKKKLLKQIQQSYSKAPFFGDFFPLLKEMVYNSPENLADFLANTLIKTADYLEIQTKFISSSISYQNTHLERQTRLIDICKKEEALIYINAIGGVNLYNKEDFKKEKIDLKFIKSNPIQYKQYNNDFVPNLSVIDVIMFNDLQTIQKLLKQYTLR